jgi:hypothetical protein
MNLIADTHGDLCSVVGEFLTLYDASLFMPRPPGTGHAKGLCPGPMRLYPKSASGEKVSVQADCDARTSGGWFRRLAGDSKPAKASLPAPLLGSIVSPRGFSSVGDEHGGQ